MSDCECTQLMECIESGRCPNATLRTLWKAAMTQMQWLASRRSVWGSPRKKLSKHWHEHLLDELIWDQWKTTWGFGTRFGPLGPLGDEKMRFFGVLFFYTGIPTAGGRNYIILAMSPNLCEKEMADFQWPLSQHGLAQLSTAQHSRALQLSWPAGQ